MAGNTETDVQRQDSLFSRCLRIWCAIRGTTTAELCRDLGIPQRTMSHWKATKGPRVADVERIAGALGLTVDEFYRAPETPEAA